jgi:hypothetical protein
MTLSNALLSMDVSQRLSYFISLLKSNERSGDRCVALHSRHAQEATCRQCRVICMELICRRLSPNLDLCM